MKIALVTTCLNEFSNVSKWQRDVLGQTRQPDEISILDAGSSDGTSERLAAWAERDKRVNLEIHPKCTVAQGRNLAIRNTSAEILVSTDMGCRLESRWIEALVTPLLSDSSVMVVAGNYKPDYSSLTTHAARASFYLSGNHAAPLGSGFLPSSRSIAYHRVVWEKLKGYPEDLTYAADDTVFAMQIHRAGFKMACAPDAMSRWYRHAALRGYWKEAFGYARGNGEALIATPKILERYPNGVSKTVGTIYAVYCTLRRSPRALMRAMVRADVFAMPLILLLIYGSTKNSLSGYEIGMKEGAIQCKACRKRLHG